jgi:hypothetical protein
MLAALCEDTAIIDKLGEILLGPETRGLPLLWRVDPVESNLVLAIVEVEQHDRIAIRDADDAALDDPRIGGR